MSLEPGRKLGSYEILSLIGTGGMGEVYRARDTKLGREDAVKVLPSAVASDSERIARLERETRRLGAVNHPNIATLHGLEESDGVHFLVMELNEGETLAERIMDGPIPMNVCVKSLRGSRRRMNAGSFTETSSRRTSKSRPKTNRRFWTSD